MSVERRRKGGKLRAVIAVMSVQLLRWNRLLKEEEKRKEQGGRGLQPSKWCQAGARGYPIPASPQKCTYAQSGSTLR